MDENVMIHVLETFFHEGIRFSLGEHRSVPKADAEHFCAHGWAKAFDGSIESKERVESPVVAPIEEIRHRNSLDLSGLHPGWDTHDELLREKKTHRKGSSDGGSARKLNSEQELALASYWDNELAHLHDRYKISAILVAIADPARASKLGIPSDIGRSALQSALRRQNKFQPRET